MKSRCTSSRVLVGLAGSALACGPDELEKPAAPDMTALVARYSAPDAVFEESDAVELRATLAGLDALLERTDVAPRLFQVLGELTAAAQQDEVTGEATAETSEATGGFKADGYFVITRICAGWEEPGVVDEPKNGALRLTATFGEAGFDPVIWGTARRCRYRVGASELLLHQKSDGGVAMSVYLGQVGSAPQLGNTALLFSLDMTASLNGDPLDLSLDFRTTDGSLIEYRIERTGASLIASAAADGTLVIRAANGNFSCDASFVCSELEPSPELSSNGN